MVNQACIVGVTNQVVSDLSKYTDFKYHFIFGNVCENKLKLHYVKPSDMPADILTNRLSVQRSKHTIRLIKSCELNYLPRGNDDQTTNNIFREIW